MKEVWHCEGGVGWSRTRSVACSRFFSMGGERRGVHNSTVHAFLLNHDTCM